MGTSAASAGLDFTERAELDWLLESGALGRSSNLIKVLRYVCEETAAGRGDHIKEYSIAVEALGRREDFDPQTDTIVRVTFHTLRKRLQDIYETGEGMSHAVRIVIPTGRYAAQFVHVPETGHTASLPHIPRPEAGLAPLAAARFASPAPQPSGPAVSRVPWFWFAALVVVGVAVATLWRESHSSRFSLMGSHPSLGPVTISGPTYILFGKGRHPYTDHSGIRWEPRPACEGGEDVPPTGVAFSATEDSYLYDGGIRGIVRCIFHAPPGHYELRLHFAEPSNLEPAHRLVSLAVNAGPIQSVDVVDRAGGDRAATTFTIPGVSPENDGTIHLDFTSEVTPVNAIEILPAPTVQSLPLRIVAASTPFKDDAGNLWLSDRYFRGGRHGQPTDQEHRPSLGLYGSGRIGTFQYSLPAPTGSKYRVTLYFREAFFGQQDGAPGGVGSRVFNVYCNGQSVLQNFDILADGHGQSVTKTIDGVSPTAQGEIILSFVPVTNYPLVNAIEVTPEKP
jgi:Malectin domain